METLPAVPDPARRAARPYHSDVSAVQPQLFPAARRPRDRALDSAVERLATASPEERGAIYTKAGVVALILDLVGYTADADLSAARILEPSFGEGDFLLPVAARLIESRRRRGLPLTADGLAGCVRAVEVHRDTFDATRAALLAQLTDDGVAADVAAGLADAWLLRGDFLLAELPGGFDAVVGNPPYIRQEALDPRLLAAYRERYATLYDRADVYVPFFERGLRLLGDGGALGYICSDRWVKNKYGGPLRRMIAEGFALTHYVDLYGASPFTQEVIAAARSSQYREPPAGR